MASGSKSVAEKGVDNMKDKQMKTEMEIRKEFLDELQDYIAVLVVKAEAEGAFETVPDYALSKSNMIDCLVNTAKNRALKSIPFCKEGRVTFL